MAKKMVKKMRRQVELKDLEQIQKLFAERDTFFNDKDDLCICWCAVGDNFYDYGEDEPEHMDVDFKYRLLLGNPRIHFIKCEDCCRCAGW